MTERYIYIIIALLPLASLMLVFQVNPYQALVVRAILGAVAALVYAVLGGADVALTEALVGTMLAVTLYVVAVRSSLVMRLGIVEGMQEESCIGELLTGIRKAIDKHYLRLEIVEYPNLSDLKQALQAKEIHAICTKRDERRALKDTATHKAMSPGLSQDSNILPKVQYDTTIRVHRLFEIMQTEASLPETTLTLISNTENKH